MTTELGRLEALDPRAYWPNEATDFTPWLGNADNIRLLGDAIGLELEVEGTEQAVGPFSADIVCRTLDEAHRVVIENQLEKTDHDHLGKLLTYAAGLEDVRTVVWVAPRFTEEHRAALDWLNDVTDSSTRSFGVELQVWRIGDSLPAPRFDVVSKPNEWSKTVRTVAEHQELSGRKQLQLQFWSGFRQYLADGLSRIRTSSASPNSWITSAVGRGGIHLVALVTDWDLAQQQQSVGGFINRVEVELPGGTAAAFFTQLVARRDTIEAQLGPLTWYAPDNVQSRKVFTQHVAARIEDQDRWPEQFEWLRQKLEAFDAVFRPIARELSAVVDDPELEVASQSDVGSTDQV